LNETQNQKNENEAQLLRSLGKLARGLSALFWGLPITLIVCAETATARADSLQAANVVFTLAANGLLLFGLWQMSGFQAQERPWRNALDRAKLLGLVNLGLCPFLFWYDKMDQQVVFFAMVLVFIVSAVFFLFNLNLVLKQLGAMLPDETLRHEAKEFTLFNRWLLTLFLIFFMIFIFSLPDNLMIHSDLSSWFGAKIAAWIQIGCTAILLFLGLTPLAITMALIWKTKEVIFNGVFGPRR